MPKEAKGNSSSSEPSIPSEETILAAFEKLFKAGEPGVRRFQPSGVRYVNLGGGAMLVEQNPQQAQPMGDAGERQTPGCLGHS
jgi:hypothetical protein